MVSVDDTAVVTLCVLWKLVSIALGLMGVGYW